MCGSSLTECDYTTKGFAWIERLNDMLDINIFNEGVSGNKLSQNLDRLKNDMTASPITSATPSKLGLKYIMFNNSANGTPTGEALIQQFRHAKYIDLNGF